MRDLFETLYPPEAKAMPVLTLPVPRAPNPPKARMNTGSIEDFYGTALLQRHRVAGGDELALIEKAFPHSRFDVMLLASDPIVRSAVADLQPATRRYVFSVARRFVDFVSAPEVIDKYGLENGALHMSFNFNQLTTDRESSMFFEKRFHLHLNYTPGRDMAFGPMRPWGSLSDTSLRRRLLDPAVFVGEAVLVDALRGSPFAQSFLPIDHQRDLRQGLPAGVKAQFPSWDFLQSPDFAVFMDELHRTAQQAYSNLRAAVVDDDDPSAQSIWWRPPLRAPADIEARLKSLDWLGPAARGQVHFLATKLRNLRPVLFSRFRRSERDRVRCLSLNGLDYSVGIFARALNSSRAPLAAAGPVVLNLQTRLFGDIGGAGLPPIPPSPLVRLDRAAGAIMTPTEVQERRSFRQAFLQAMVPELGELGGIHS